MTNSRNVLGYGQPKRPDSPGRPDAPPAEPMRAPRGTPMDAPIEAIVRVNVACNQHCFFCNTDTRAENLHETPEKVYRYIEANRGALYLSFSGGEPTINPHILSYVAHARAIGIPRVVVQTNAMMSSYEPFADKLVAAGVTGAFISLHAPRGDVSDRITATPGSWPLTLKGIRNLLDRGVEVELNCVINAMNAPLLGEYARFVVEKFPEITAISMSVVAPTGFCVVSERTIPRIRDLQPHLFEALKTFDEAGICAKVPDRCGLPLCTVRGFEKHHEALMAGPFAGGGTVTDDHTKHAGCAECVWDTKCIGYWTACVDLYGTDDLIPVTEPVHVVPQPLPYEGATPELVAAFLKIEKKRLTVALDSGD